MSNILTRKGLENLRKRLEQKQLELRNLLEEKAHAYNASGDGWHDNPGWIQIGQKEEQISREIGALQSKIAGSRIIEINPENADKVQLGLIVTFEQMAIKSGKSMQFRYLIATEEETDVKNNIISMNSPIGKALYGLNVNQNVRIKLPAGEFELTILKIEFGDE